MNQKKKEVKKGIDVLPPDLELMRQQVIRSEYRARLWKADYETAYYSIELDKISPAYTALLEKQRAEAEELHKKREQEILKSIKELNPEAHEVEIDKVDALTENEK